MMPKVLSSDDGIPKFRKKLRSMKKLPSVIFVLLLLVGLPVAVFLVNKVTQLRTGAAPGNVVLSILPLNATIGIGETSDLMVWVNPSTDSVSSMQLVLTYDQTVVQVMDVVPAAFYTDPAPQIGPPLVIQKDLTTPGKIVYSISFPLPQNASTPAYSSSAVAEAVKISVKGLKQGSTQFSFVTTGTGVAITKIADPLGNNLLKTATGNTVNVAGGVRLLFGSTTPVGTQSINTNFTLPVVLNTNGQAVDAVDALVRFDPAVFTAVSVAKNDTSGFSSYPSLTIDNTTGTVSISANVGSGATTTPVNGAAVTLATITMKPKINSSATQITYDFTAGSRNDSNVLAHVTQSGAEPQDILAAVSPVTIVVGTAATASPTGTAIATASPSPTPTDVIVPRDPPTGTGTATGSGKPTASPSPTPTATATASPVAQSITMNLKFQGRTRTGAVLPSSVTVSYRLANTAASTAQTVTVTPNTSAQTTTSLLPGSYVFLVKAPGYLPRRYGSDQTPIVIGTATTTVDFTGATLLGGDFNNDGVINEVDYTLKFLTSFAKVDNIVDLDGSGQVNNLDYGVMRSNWSIAGDSL